LAESSKPIALARQHVSPCEGETSDQYLVAFKRRAYVYGLSKTVVVQLKLYSRLLQQSKGQGQCERHCPYEPGSSQALMSTIPEMASASSYPPKELDHAISLRMVC
jgi:hypothetical protein